MQKNIYKVYSIFNKFTDQIVYVGLTRTTLKRRYDCHVCRKKFNRNHYGINLIQEKLTLDQAVQLEKMLIEQYNLIENGWNQSPGSINGASNYHTEEQKKKWSKERKGCKVSKEHAAKNRIARKGKKNSKKHNELISKAKSKKVMCLENGITYKSRREAAKDLGLNSAKISLVCSGKRKTTGGYHFVDVEEAIESDRNDLTQSKD